MRTEPLYGFMDDGGLRFDEAQIGLDHYTFWRGVSGRRYLATIYSLEDVPDYSEAIVLFVRREADGRRTAHHVEQVEAPFTADRLSLLRQARAQGINEVHMHFLAQGPAQRRRVMLDLRAMAEQRQEAVRAS